VRGVDGDRNRAGYFQRARHADAVDLGAGFLQCLHRAGQERVRDVVVIARLDDENARTLARALTTLASPRPGHRLLLLGRGRTKPGGREQARPNSLTRVRHDSRSRAA